MGWAGKQDQDNSDDCNIVSVKFVWDNDDPGHEVKPMVCINIAPHHHLPRALSF